MNRKSRFYVQNSLFPRTKTIAVVAENQERRRGAALVMALLFLSFLTVLGGALLTTSTIDVWISDNYKVGTQNLYLAEAGIEEAREVLRISSATPTQLLTAAAGTNAALSTGGDLATLLASDDQPLIPADPSLRAAGQALTDSTGRVIGRYHVWLRNDNADGAAALTDTNEVLTLLGIGRIGTARKVIQVTIRKSGFPENEMHPMLNTVSGLERLVTSITLNANDIYNPAYGAAEPIGDYGSSSNYRVAVVNGDAALGAGNGYGILLARGNVTVSGNFTWHGLILIIGQGVLRWDASHHGFVEGEVFIAGTRANDRSPSNLLGTLLANRGESSVDFKAGERDIRYNASSIAMANRAFPYIPMAVTER